MTSSVSVSPFRETPITRISKVIRKIVLVPNQKKQGRHIDPLEAGPANIAEWPQDRQEAWTSSETTVFKNCLRSGDLDIRNTVLAELSAFYGYPVDECYERCMEWEAWSVKVVGTRTPITRGPAGFLRHCRVLVVRSPWYTYLQTEGYGYPASVLAASLAAREMSRRTAPRFRIRHRHHQPGFPRLGFHSTSADVSKPCSSLRRGASTGTATCRGIDLTATKLEAAASRYRHRRDTLVHVPDFDEVRCATSHRIARPGGWLLTNFLDVRDSDSLGERPSHPQRPRASSSTAAMERRRVPSALERSPA